MLDVNKNYIIINFRARQLKGDDEPVNKQPQCLIRNDETKIAFSLGGKKPLCDSKTLSTFCNMTNANSTLRNNMTPDTSTPSSSYGNKRDVINKGIF